MKAEELRKMEIRRLMELVEAKKQELIKLKMKFLKAKNKGNVRQIRTAKKDMARVYTIIYEKRHEKAKNK
ncbi:MAG: 50S ribosomal protein L29 [Patescibacteria group bacterium]|nr:50S ribosomal protein L29 [Patescibacteria group bacterium]